MSIEKDDIKVITGKRLKELCKKVGITQVDLAEKIGRSSVHVSNLACGKAAMTDRTASSIHELYPDFSVEYLTGRSPYRNDRERELAEQAENEQQRDMLDLGIGALAESLDYAFTATAIHKPLGNPKNGVQRLVPDTGIIVERDGKTVVIAREDMRRIQCEVRDFLDFKIQQAFKTNGERG